MPTATLLSGETISIDLSTRDFEGFRSDILSSGGLADLYTPDWSDRSQFDLGVSLVEALCFLADNLSYYQDRVGNEALFPSAVQRRSVIEHCKLLGYELRSAVSAVASMTMVSNGAGVIPAGAVVMVDATDGTAPVRYELATAQVFVGAETVTGILAYEGTTYTEVVGSSTGSAGQEFRLKRTPLALNPDGTSSLVLTIRTGMVDVIWTEVSNFLNSDSSDLHFTANVDEYDVTTVTFGDGVNGAIPSSGTDNILASYRVGGGHIGNEVGPNRITKLAGSYPFITSVTNPIAPNSGLDKETIAEAKYNAPRSLRAFDRCVNYEDYAAKAMEVSGVRFAIAHRGVGAYEVKVIIASAGATPIPTGSWDEYTETGTGLLYAVGNYLTQRKTTPTILKVEPARVAEVYFVAAVHCLPTARASNVRRVVEDAIDSVFDPDTQTMGKQFPISNVYRVIENLVGVDYVDIIQMQRYPNARLAAGGSTDVAFSAFTVGAETVEDVYIVKFTDATTYTVTGNSTGYQGTGVLDVAFLTTDKMLGFLASSGMTAPTNATKFEIKTSSYVANINPDYDELVVLRNGTFQLTIFGGVV